MFLVMCPLVLLCAGPDLVVNGDFASALDHWQRNSPDRTMDVVSVDGRPAARIVVPADAKAPLGYPGLYQEFPVTPGDVVEVAVELRARGVTDGYGAYAALEFYPESGPRISFVQSEGARGDKPWTQATCRGVAPPNVGHARVVVLLNGRGEGEYRNVSARVVDKFDLKPLDGPVTLKVTGDVACEHFLGFGFEDDGWFYNEENASHGVTEEDYALRESRVAWMEPDHVRMFFWIKDYCPSGDWETFDWDTPNMRSHYRTLDLYQRLGTDINVTGVEWGLAKPYEDTAKAARGIGSLFEHLIKDKGYTCVKYWTLTNEPNGSWLPRNDTYEHFAALTHLVREEFDKRGLDVKVVGSDDTSGFDWFKACATDPAYAKTADIFASHRYCQFPDRILASFFYDDRLNLLAAQNVRKPLVIEEFGFQDGRSGTVENPIMKTYPYALWTSAFCIEGLNKGVAGFSIWALHEMYYPGNGFMEYALWDYKTNGWKTRPVYHAWSNFTRLTRKGDTVRRCESSARAHVLGAVVGNTLFWVNQGDQAAEVRIEGFPAKTVRVMTEDTIEGDREGGTVRPLDGGRFTAPPFSFGYVRQD